MDTRKFVQRLRDFARDNDIPMRVVSERGKGSHRMIYFGDKCSTIPWGQEFVREGTRRKILSVLGIDPRALE